jgi:hypothetical protein
MSIVDVMLHLDDSLDKEQRNKLEDFVRGDACVITACVSHEDPHLMMVTYNPECTTAGKILNRVSGEAGRAELVGL